MSSRIKNMEKQILSDKFFKLSEINFDYQMKKGEWVNNTWEVVDRGNAASALIYNKKKNVQ